MSTALQQKKICTKCKELKPLIDFHVESRNKTHGRTAVCIECTKVLYQKDYLKVKARNDGYYYERGGREKSLERHLKNTLQFFGLAKEDYDFLVSLGCTICKTHPTGKHRLHFDHDHTTGEFRGLLCGNCNTAIGLLGDDIVKLKQAIKYLSSFKENI